MYEDARFIVAGAAELESAPWPVISLVDGVSRTHAAVRLMMAAQGKARDRGRTEDSRSSLPCSRTTLKDVLLHKFLPLWEPGASAASLSPAFAAAVAQAHRDCTEGLSDTVPKVKALFAGDAAAGTASGFAHRDFPSELSLLRAGGMTYLQTMARALRVLSRNGEFKGFSSLRVLGYAGKHPYKRRANDPPEPRPTLPGDLGDIQELIRAAYEKHQNETPKMKEARKQMVSTLLMHLEHAVPTNSVMGLDLADQSVPVVAMRILYNQELLRWFHTHFEPAACAFLRARAAAVASPGMDPLRYWLFHEDASAGAGLLEHWPLPYDLEDARPAARRGGVRDSDGEGSDNDDAMTQQEKRKIEKRLRVVRSLAEFVRHCALSGAQQYEKALLRRMGRMRVPFYLEDSELREQFARIVSIRLQASILEDSQVVNTFTERLQRNLFQFHEARARFYQLVEEKAQAIRAEAAKLP